MASVISISGLSKIAKFSSNSRLQFVPDLCHCDTRVGETPMLTMTQNSMRIWLPIDGCGGRWALCTRVEGFGFYLKPSH